MYGLRASVKIILRPCFFLSFHHKIIAKVHPGSNVTLNFGWNFAMWGQKKNKVMDLFIFIKNQVLLAFHGGKLCHNCDNEAQILQQNRINSSD